MNIPKKRLVTLAVLASLSLTACNESTSSTAGAGFDKDKDTTGDFDQGAMVTALVDNVITPTYQSFATQASNQNVAIAAYCEAEKALDQQTVEQAEVDQAKTEAQDAWRSAMNVWQQVEMMQMEPLKASDGLLRNSIYLWPVVNSCAVDFDVVFFDEGTVNGQPYDIKLRTPSRKGMAALEYLLFTNDLNHSCTGTSVPPGWDGYQDTERKVARCNFAVEISSDIQGSADSLVERWLADSGQANQLKQAGTANSAIETEHDAVNLISDAMFYLDSQTKDGKLAIPAGILSNSCGNNPCPEDVESPHSNHSLTNILNNLSAFEMLLTGDAGLGFTDYLADEGDEATANAMTSSLTKAKATIEASDVSLAQSLETNADAATQMHAEVKEVTDKLKVDFINSLALKLPSTSAGDND